MTRKMPDVRSISMGVWVNVGARDETRAESGLSHFIEHMIFKGTRKRNAFEIAKAFDAIGGQTNAFTSMESTCYHAKVMDTHLETMVDILSDIFLNSVFDAQEIERERLVIAQEIGMVEDSPEEYVHVLAGRTFWGDHPVGRSILGSRQNVLDFATERVIDFFQRFYQPQRIVISAAGNLTHDKIIDLIGPLFESIAPGNGFPERSIPQSFAKVENHPKDLEQVHMCLGAPGIAIVDPGRYALSLANTILGGNMSSRLFQEIREKRGLAYSIYSFSSSLSDAGMFGVYAGVDPQNTQKTLEVILQQMQTLKATAIDSSRLQDAKEYTKGNLLLASESVDNQMVRLAQNELHFERQIALTEVVEKIDAVSPADITAMTQTLFDANRLSLTMLGPVSKETDAGQMLTL